MTKLKICGLRELDHVLAAANAGADFLGFVFVPGVRRRLAVEQARELLQEYRRRKGKGGPHLVGLFADQALAEVNYTVRRCSLDMAQLCGSEPPEYWRQVKVPVVRQLRVPDDRPRAEIVTDLLRRVEEVVTRGHIALLDREEPGRLGGTGRPFDWSIAREVGRRHNFLLAGGLTPENIGDAIATVEPWGVDVSSGVETGGVKDSAKITAFARQVRRAGQRDPSPR